MFCIKCGKEIPEATKFCPYCGVDVSNSANEESIASETSNESREESLNKKKSINKTIIVVAIIAAVAAIVIVLLITNNRSSGGREFDNVSEVDTSTSQEIESAPLKEDTPPILRILDANIRLEVGRQRQISITTENIPDGTRLEWTSGNPTIVDVRGDGTVIAYAPGHAEVSVTAVIDGKNYRSSVLVTVNEDNNGQLEMRASHILFIDYNHTPEIRSEIEKILERIKKGEDFAELAKEYSEDDNTAASGGDLGVFSLGDLVPEFEKACLELKPGEVSGIVETEYGFHIIKMTHKSRKNP